MRQHHVKQRPFIWPLLCWLIAFVLLVPVAVMLISSVGFSGSLFSHLWQTVLPTYISNTLQLSLYVVVLALIFGVPSAAFITQTNIKTKGVLRWLLLLPLAMPGYVIAYLYTDLFDYAGIVQRSLRAWFGWQSPHDYWFFDIRSLGGASIILALVLYPYVYMLARTAFEQQDKNLIRAGRSLGLTAKEAFFQIGLPLARPAIMVAATLVMMETIADFATVQYFAVNTLTTAIYDTWLGYGDIAAANGLASVLLMLVLIVVVIELRSRTGQKQQTNRPNTEKQIIHLTAPQQIGGLIFCWLLVSFGFLLPLMMLINMAYNYAEFTNVTKLVSIGLQTIEVSLYAATVTVIIALLLALFYRLHAERNGVKQPINRWPLQLSGFGYAIPGTVLAMALLATFGPLDHFINQFAVYLHLPKPGLVLSGTIVAVVFAFVVRFAAIANGTIMSGLEKHPSSLDLAPSTLGMGKISMLFVIHLPLIKNSIIVAWLLVFVEAMKELPAVLLLRPFNFETLSTFVYQLISDEKLEQGAIGAICIVLFGLLPIIWLNTEKTDSRV